MPLIRSYGNAFEVVDYSMEIANIPQVNTLLGDTGLFQEEFLSTHTVTFEEVNGSLGLVGDVPRGAKPQANKDDVRKIRSYPLARFAMTDAILPQDIQGRRAYGSTDAAETEAAVLMRKMERAMRNYSATMEAARFSTLTTGAIYAPNGTIAGNFFTDFGVVQKVVDFDLTVGTVDVVAKVEEVIAYLQDTVSDTDMVTGVIGYCSPEFFAAFIAHPKIQSAYTYYSATEGQSILRNRAGNDFSLNRRFTYAGVTLVEVRNIFAGQRAIPIDEAVFVPLGTQDAFVTAFGPMERLDFVNTMAERMYALSYRDPKGLSVDLDFESNFINILKKPALVVKGTRT